MCFKAITLSDLTVPSFPKLSFLLFCSDILIYRGRKKVIDKLFKVLHRQCNGILVTLCLPTNQLRVSSCGRKLQRSPCHRLSNSPRAYFFWVGSV